MRIKMFMATAAIAITGVVAPGASAAERTPTKVTIQNPGNGEFYGQVKSEDPANCADGRKVTLFKMLGDAPDPGADQKIVSDTASANGDGYEWNAGNTGYRKGRFYARVKRTELCAGDLSKVIRAQP